MVERKPLFSFSKTIFLKILSNFFQTCITWLTEYVYYRHELKKKARNLPVKIDIVLKIYCWDSSLKFLGELKAIFLPLLSAERVVFNVFQMTYVGPWRPKKKKLKNMGEEAKKWGVPQADARISLKSLLANFSWKTIYPSFHLKMNGLSSIQFLFNESTSSSQPHFYIQFPRGIFIEAVKSHTAF